MSQSPQLFPTLLGVFVAGGFGATLRVLLVAGLDRVVAARIPFAGTLAANLLGCFLIGVCAHALPETPVRPVVIGGLLGGFTTYSAFALFTVEMAGQARFGPLTLQVAAHLLGGAICVIAGMGVARMLGSA